jgi:membrane fusion protein (multidrug efflux system)
MISRSTAFFLLAAGAAACVLSACADTKGAQQPAASAKPDQAAAAAERPAVAVTLATVAAADLTQAIDVVGSLAAKFSADVKSEVSGTVVEVYVTQWVPVRRGAPLARLDTTETEAALDALKAIEAQARVAETRAKREHDRAKELKAYGLITTQAFDEATSALEAAEAATKSAAAQVRTGTARLAKSSIKSPMDGIVAERLVSVGDRVENVGGGGTMFRIVDNRLLDLTVTVPSPQLAGVRTGQQIEFTTNAVPGRTFAGKVMFINPSVEADSRAAKVVAEVRNTDGALKGGMFVEGRILTMVRHGVLQVPRAALLNWNVGDCTADVFVVRDGRAQKRTVQTGTGTAAGAPVEITSGLAPGDRVVVRGGFALRDGDAVTVAAAQGS